VLSYFSASLKVNPEGDVLISDGTIQSLGNNLLCFVQPLFATFTSALVSIYSEPPHRTERHTHGFSTDQALDADFFWQEEVMTDDELKPDIFRRRPHDLAAIIPNAKAKDEESLLIAVIPHPGYFVAVCSDLAAACAVRDLLGHREASLESSHERPRHRSIG
jgi:solute carrier family 25 phosphate transporter 23/24/25/41